MTSEEYDKLSDEEKRIKVAELCGWSDINPKARGASANWTTINGRNPAKSHFNYEAVPDYLNDLNAMHEAERAVPTGKMRTYAIELHHSSGLHDISLGAHMWRFMQSATAAQRAEAMAVTMGSE